MRKTFKLYSSVYDKFKKDNLSSNLENSSFMASFVTKTNRWNSNYLLSILDNHIIH